ncbi:MAG TPA: 2-phospho-L-lactate transferase [Candidatus Acidoferrales bacterium]|nr:2-phospho-L-lactate transferase [Candidatus Acidoferrales bacterium]
MIAVLTGGTGGAKLVHGLSLAVSQEQLFVICNTGDDFVFHGLYVSPDIDTVMYTLAGIADPLKGWGIKDDTFAWLDAMARLGAEAWFKIGDRDLATHVRRTDLLRQGLTLSQATQRLACALGVTARIAPMSDERVATRVLTPAGEISFQEFFVKNRCRDAVTGVRLSGVENSRPAPAVERTILSAALVIVAPSNPVTSIGPILAVPGIREALRKTPAPVIAVSPIIQRRPFSGPADKLMSAAGIEVSALGVAASYADFLDLLFIAPEDRALAERMAPLGVQARPTSIALDSSAERKRLAEEILAAADHVR